MKAQNGFVLTAVMVTSVLVAVAAVALWRTHGYLFRCMQHVASSELSLSKVRCVVAWVRSETQMHRTRLLAVDSTVVQVGAPLDATVTWRRSGKALCVQVVMESDVVWRGCL